jgi:hypothetical protein
LINVQDIINHELLWNGKKEDIPSFITTGILMQKLWEQRSDCHSHLQDEFHLPEKIITL